MAIYYGKQQALLNSSKEFKPQDIILEFSDASDDIVKLKVGPRSGQELYGNLPYIVGDVPDTGCLGSIKEDNLSDFPSSPNKGDWVLIEDCINNYPGQAGIGVFDGSTWNVLPIPKGDFDFPEPTDDGKLYFRSRDFGDINGNWVVFDKVNGESIIITINTKDSSVEGTYVPKLNELVWDSNRKILVIGDGVTQLQNMFAFYEGTLTDTDIISALGYTPEDSANKGQPYGYAPLGADSKVPDAFLPANLTDTYSKAEIDQKDSDVTTALTTLVNNEASTARAKEQAITDDLSDHVTDMSMHVNQNEKDAWNAKVDASDLTDYENHISDDAIHVTQQDKDRWDGMNKAYYVTDFDDLPLNDNQVGNMGYVQVSDPGVTPVVCDQYIWDGTAWQQYDVGQLSLQFIWGNIQGRPNSTVLSIDNTVAVAHNHNNKLVLDKISQSAAGNFMYDGVEIGVKAVFADVDALLPVTGEENTLYVVIRDSRVRDYPSISVWSEGAYQILGRGTQDAPPAVGDMSILQNEYFSVEPGSSFMITVNANQFFAFMPVEILKEVDGLKDQNKVITNFSEPTDFNYNRLIINISSESKLRIFLEKIPATLDLVGDAYYSHAEVDLSDYKDVDCIE